MDEAQARERIGILRLECLQRRGASLHARSSITNWFGAVAAQVPSLAFVVPVRRGRGQRKPDGPGYRLRNADRLLALPDIRGYLRVLLFAPLVFLQLVRLRRFCRTVVARVPEHGNWLTLPLLRVLGFRVVIWLVAHRGRAEEAQRRRRGSGIRVRIGLWFSRRAGRAEHRALRRYPVIANGSELAVQARRLQGRSCRVLAVTSSALRREDLSFRAGRRRVRGGPFRVLYVGRVAVEKGLGDLVDALARCRNQGAWSLRIVGWASHGEEARLRAHIDARGVQDIVEVAGPCPYGSDLFACYRDADVFALPSHTEGTPRVLVEAMAFGLPIVATAVGGVPDLVREERHGLLVPPRDPDAFAHALQRLRRDPSLRSTMGRVNRRTAQGHTVESLADRMLAFIRHETEWGERRRPVDRALARGELS